MWTRTILSLVPRKVLYHWPCLNIPYRPSWCSRRPLRCPRNVSQIPQTLQNNNLPSINIINQRFLCRCFMSCLVNIILLHIWGDLWLSSVLCVWFIIQSTNQTCHADSADCNSVCTLAYIVLRAKTSINAMIQVLFCRSVRLSDYSFSAHFNILSDLIIIVDGANNDQPIQ